VAVTYSSDDAYEAALNYQPEKLIPMLNATHRFHGYGSLRKVYSRSQNIRGTSVSLRYSPRSLGRPYRVAVVVSKKVNKSAVTRNRIRRRIYEIVRLSENVPDATNLVFTVYSDNLADDPSAEIVSLINELLVKCNQSLSA
jgi:ribonuclease P protein component